MLVALAATQLALDPLVPRLPIGPKFRLHENVEIDAAGAKLIGNRLQPLPGDRRRDQAESRDDLLGMSACGSKSRTAPVR